MQPPDTEPTMAPLSSTPSWLPTGRGEEPQVVMTVAMATPLPDAFHLLICSRTSSASLMVYSLRTSVCHPANRLSAPQLPIFDGAAPRAKISPARLSRLCTGRNSSTWGNMALLP